MGGAVDPCCSSDHFENGKEEAIFTVHKAGDSVLSKVTLLRHVSSENSGKQECLWH